MDVECAPLSAEVFDSLEKNVRYFHEHLDELIEEFPDKYVVLYNGKLIANGKKIEKLVEQIEAEELDINMASFEFVPKTNRVLVV